MARRHLGMTVEEWDALPWWQARMYVAGLIEEFGAEQGSSGGQPPEHTHMESAGQPAAAASGRSPLAVRRIQRFGT